MLLNRPFKELFDAPMSFDVGKPSGTIFFGPYSGTVATAAMSRHLRFSRVREL